MTNRMRLLRAANDLGRIMEDLAVSPTPYSSLEQAREMMIRASQFPLDTEERKEAKPIDGFST